MITRVLCTFGVAYDGGIQRVMMDGLPLLSGQPDIELHVGDLYERAHVKALLGARGLSVVEVGVAGPAYTSLKRGGAAIIDRVIDFPRHCLLAYRLRRAAHFADVVYVHTYKELVIATLSGASIVWHCHGLGIIPPFLARFAQKCKFVIAVSNAVASTLHEHGVAMDRIITIPNAVDAQGIGNAALLPKATTLPQRRGSTIVLLPTASIREQKGAHILLEAARNLPQVDIWITGDMKDSGKAAEYIHRLTELSQSPEFRNRVHFLGFRTDIYSVMMAADIVCVPSLCPEGFGLVAAEAMTLRKPVVVSDQGALPELVGNDGGVIFDITKPKELESILARLSSDPEYARRLGASAASRALQRFSYNRWAHDVGQTLKNSRNLR
jgi:glycosyltransferase involved in cell wall biosynthesis